MEQLKTYWYILTKRWWLVLALAVLGAAAGYGLSKTQEPVFRSSARLYVMPARPDHGTTYYTQNIVRQYGQLITSDYFLKKASEGLGLSPQELRSRVVASGDVEYLAINVNVDDTDPARARALAQRLAQEFVQEQEARMRGVSPDYRIDVRSYEDASAASLYRPLTRANTAAAGFLGLLVGIVIAFVLDLADDTIKTAEDVDRFVGVPVLAHIPAPF